MIPLWFVGDGPRDGAALPKLVETILGSPVRGEFSRWARLHSRTTATYARKLRFATLQAQDAKAIGLVAVVDADTLPERIRQLAAARTDHRNVNPPFPTALGQANPHGEAWLLDDPAAVRKCLSLETNVAVLPVTKCEPKSALEDLIRQSTRANQERLRSVSISLGILPAWSTCRAAPTSRKQGCRPSQMRSKQSWGLCSSQGRDQP